MMVVVVENGIILSIKLYNLKLVKQSCISIRLALKLGYFLMLKDQFDGFFHMN